MGIANVDEFLGRFPTQLQCDTQSPMGRCPDKAFYVVERVNRPIAHFCARCVTSVLYYGTQAGRNVIIGRLDG